MRTPHLLPLALPLLIPATLVSQRNPQTTTNKAVLHPWDRLAQLEAGSTFIVRGILHGSEAQLQEASRSKGGYLDLQIGVREAIKQPGADQLGKRLSFRFYAAPRKDNRYGYTPDLETMQALLSKDREERDVIVFLSYSKKTLYLTNRFSNSIVSPRIPGIVAMRRRITQHRKLQRVPLPVIDKKLDRHVRQQIKDLARSVDQQRAALAELEQLGERAVPAIVRAMDDRRPLAEPRIVLRNRAVDRFEATRTYSPKLVIDALAALLNQMTGVSFGMDTSHGNDLERRQELAGWHIFAHYLQRKRLK